MSMKSRDRRARPTLESGRGAGFHSSIGSHSPKPPHWNLTRYGCQLFVPNACLHVISHPDSRCPSFYFFNKRGGVVVSSNGQSSPKFCVGGNCRTAWANLARTVAQRDGWPPCSFYQSGGSSQRHHPPTTRT